MVGVTADGKNGGWWSEGDGKFMVRWYGLEYCFHGRSLSRVEEEELPFCSSDFGSGVDAATIFAIISTVAERESEL